MSLFRGTEEDEADEEDAASESSRSGCWRFFRLRLGASPIAPYLITKLTDAPERRYLPRLSSKSIKGGTSIKASHWNTLSSLIGWILKKLPPLSKVFSQVEVAHVDDKPAFLIYIAGMPLLPSQLSHFGSHHCHTKTLCIGGA